MCAIILETKKFGNKIYVKNENKIYNKILNILIYLFNLFLVIFILKMFTPNNEYGSI